MRRCQQYRSSAPERYAVGDLRRPQWVSSDGKWLWDGRNWRSTRPPFTVGRLPKASATAWINRVVLAIQGSGIGCAGLMLAMIGVIATLGGALLTALALFGAAAVGLLVAAGFW